MTKQIGKVPKVSDITSDAAFATGKAKSIANLRKGGGRAKGVPNKNTKALKDMILGALAGAGGQEYLQRQAEDNPTAFMGLIGKVLPTELKGAGEGGAIVVQVVTGVSRD